MQPAGMLLEAQICSEPFLNKWKPWWSWSLLKKEQHKATSPKPLDYLFSPTHPTVMPIPAFWAQLFQLHISVSFFTKYFTVSQCSNAYQGLQPLFFSSEICLSGISMPWPQLAPQMLFSSIGSSKSAATEPVSNPFSLTSWTSSSLLSQTPPLGICSFFQSHLCAQPALHCCSGQRGHAVGKCQTGQQLESKILKLHLHYTVFNWFHLISQVPKFLWVTVSRSQLPQWLS